MKMILQKLRENVKGGGRLNIKKLQKSKKLSILRKRHFQKLF